MKNITRKLLIFILTLTVALSIATPLSAEAAVSYPKSLVVYKTSKYARTQYLSINVTGLGKKDVIKPSSLKTSNKKILEPEGVQMGSYESDYKYTPYNPNYELRTYNFQNYYAYVRFQMKNAGTATASYKVGSKTYKTKVTVKDYVNPIKTATITNIKNGKDTNLAEKLKYQNNNNLRLKKDTPNVKVQIATQSNWRIKSLSATNNATGKSYSMSDPKGMSTATLNAGTIRNKEQVYVRAELFNKKDKGTMNCYFYIN